MKRPAPPLPLLLAAAVLLPAPARGQTVADLAATCAPFAPGRCVEAAVAARTLQLHVGLLAGLGSEVPGSAATLGRRLGTTPRIALSARSAFAHVAVPDLTDGGPPPSRETTAVVPAVHGSLAVGVFDGVRITPTVGGLLSLDLLGSTSAVFLPKGDGFGGMVAALSVGARVGILREGFTVPGVSVSLSRRLAATATLGDLAAGDATAVEIAPRVWSVRATAGKDLLSVGVTAGVGWDRYGGDARVRVAAGLPAGVRAPLRSSRTLVFAGASLNFLVLQLSAEAGWARGAGAVQGYEGAPFDPAAGTGWGGLAFRLTL